MFSHWPQSMNWLALSVEPYAAPQKIEKQRQTELRQAREHSLDDDCIVILMVTAVYELAAG